MNRLKLTLIAMLTAGVLSSGCVVPNLVPPEVSGALKLANDQVGELTASEIAALVTRAQQFGVDIDVTITEDDAQAIVEFFDVNDVQTINDVTLLVEQFVADPSSIEVPDAAFDFIAAQLGGDTVHDNQGGGNVATAARKIQRGQISTLTADELQALQDAIVANDPSVSTGISDEQAEAIRVFLVDNNINTITDFEAIVQQAETDPGSVELPEGAEDLF